VDSEYYYLDLGVQYNDGRVSSLQQFTSSGADLLYSNFADRAD